MLRKLIFGPSDYRLLVALANLYDLVLSERFNKWYKTKIEQAGAQKGRGCEEQILSVKLLIDIARKTNKPLYVTFVDYVKAYDRVPRYKLMELLDNKGCGTKFLRALQHSMKNTYCKIGE